MELDFLTFNFGGTERKARRVNLSDYSAIREAIRRERLAMLNRGASADTIAAVIAQPILDAEQMDYLMSVLGQALILFRCVREVDERFTMADAETMMFQGHDFPFRLYVESGVITEPAPDDLAKSLLKLGFAPEQIRRFDVATARQIVEMQCPKP